MSLASGWKYWTKVRQEELAKEKRMEEMIVGRKERLAKQYEEGKKCMEEIKGKNLKRYKVTVIKSWIIDAYDDIEARDIAADKPCNSVKSEVEKIAELI